MRILSRKFYNRDTVQVAKDLLGKTLVRKIGKQKLTGTIIEDEEQSGAVLIRSIKPLLGITDMLKNRKIDVISNLTNGPAKLTQAMKITTKHYNVDLTKNLDLFIMDGIKPTKIIARPRVGITIGVDKLWNFSFKI